MRPKYGIFQKKANIVIFLSSGVAGQHRKARDDLIALLLYEFLNLNTYITVYSTSLDKGLSTRKPIE